MASLVIRMAAVGSAGRADSTGERAVTDLINRSPVLPATGLAAGVAETGAQVPLCSAAVAAAATELPEQMVVVVRTRASLGQSSVQLPFYRSLADQAVAAVGPLIMGAVAPAA